jgi:hypothetical protein
MEAAMVEIRKEPALFVIPAIASLCSGSHPAG